MNTLREVLFVADLSELLGITESAVRKALASGELGPYGVLGRRLFVRRESLAAHLMSLEVDPKRAPTRGPSRTAEVGRA